MKKKLIIAAIAILVVLAIATPVCVFRDRIPRKINSDERFEEVFGIEIDPEYVVEEYSFYTIDNYVNRPKTSLCFKLSIPHQEFKDYLNELGVYVRYQPEEIGFIKDLNELLPEDKKLKIEDVSEHYYLYLLDLYEAIPGLMSSAVTQSVYWCYTVEDGEEYVYMYTFKYRNYVPAMTAK